MPEKDRFPIRYGRGHSKVTIYNRTTALPYFRLCYRFGPVRHQSTFNCLEQAIVYARHIEGTLRSKDAGGALVARGYIAETELELVVGAVVTLAGVIWSAIAKRKAAK